MEQHVHAPLKTKMAVILSIAAVYMLLNYIPFSSFFSEELYYLIFRLGTYGILALVAYILTHKLHVHCYCPLKELNKAWLIPLLIPCFTNFIYTMTADVAVTKEFEPLILGLDLAADFLGSVIEDLIFIEAVVSVFMDYYPKNRKHPQIEYIVITSLIFTVVHCYSFMYYSWDVALYQLLIVFLLSLECCYLAIYYDSPWVPLLAHFLYNAINLVTFTHFFTFDVITVEFVIFTSLTIAMAICYCAALVKISTLQELRDEEKLH